MTSVPTYTEFGSMGHAVCLCPISSCVWVGGCIIDKTRDRMLRQRRRRICLVSAGPILLCLIIRDFYRKIIIKKEETYVTMDDA